MSRLSDQWAAASTYEYFMGRWSRTLARDYIRWLRPGRQLHWLELGCGTGALTSAICTDADPTSVTACDPIPQFVDYARQSLRDDRASFVVAAADDFPLRTARYDVTASSLALNFFPAPAAAVERMRAGTAPGGVVSACVWDYAGDMQFLRHFWDAAVEVDPRARELDEGMRFPICRPDALVALFRAAGLTDVECAPIDVPTEFENVEDYWSPFLGGTGPAPSFVASLDAEDREMLRTNLVRRIPRDSRGAISLRARAWAVRGTV